MTLTLALDSKNSLTLTAESKNSLSLSNESKPSLVRVGSLPGTFFSGYSPNETAPGTNVRVGDLTPNTIISNFVLTNETKN